jgi:hypothetical protein
MSGKLARRKAMKIHTKDFRMAEGDQVDLKKWPTKVDSIYKSKAQYKTLLEEHVAKLSVMQQLHCASNRHAILLMLSGDGCRGKRRGRPARDVIRFPTDHLGLAILGHVARRKGQ